MRIRRPKRVSKAGIIVSGPDSALDSSIADQALSEAKIDCAYHRAKVCKIEYTELTVITGFPDLEVVGTFSCLRSCGRIVEAAAALTTDLLEEKFEGQPVNVSGYRIID
jgi:hypothetical protein